MTVPLALSRDLDITGEITNITIGADNPQGFLFPFGHVTVVADNLVIDLAGTITPVGELVGEAIDPCFDTVYSCVADPVTEYDDCIAVCEVPTTPTLPEELIAGVIIPVGTLDTLVEDCEPVLIGSFSGPQVNEDLWQDSFWFKQSGSFSSEIQDNHVVNSAGFTPTHAVGPHLGHIGEPAPIIPANYEVSIWAFLGSDSGGGGAPNYGAGVIGRIPLTATFNDIKGYYFVYNAPAAQFRLLRSYGGGDIFSTVPVTIDNADASDYEDQLIKLTLRFEGSTITGFAQKVGEDRVQVVQGIDATYSLPGRVGIVTPWTVAASGYLQGPFTVYDLSNLPIGQLMSTLEHPDGTILEETDLVLEQTFTPLLWTDPSPSVEQLSFSALAGTPTRDVYRERTISGFTPETPAKITGTMSLNRGSIGAGLEFGIKVIGDTEEALFDDLLGVEIIDVLVFELNTTADVDGNVVIRYGAFGDGTDIPAGDEWDDGQYSWVFQMQSLAAFDDCEE